jgi:ABC-type phosphate transport system permease subunit
VSASAQTFERFSVSPRRRRKDRIARGSVVAATAVALVPLALIYTDVTSPTTAVVNRAWGAALTLVVMILLLNLFARLLARRSRLG